MKKLLRLASLLLIITGCSETEVFNDVIQQVSVSAKMENDANRSLAMDGGGFAWAKGDVIGVYTSTGTFREFTLNQEGGSASANFSGGYVGGETSSKCAVYPYNGTHKVAGNILTYHLPLSYGNYKDDYAPNTQAPMVARFSDGSKSFNFRHIGGVFKFTLNNVPQNGAEFVFTAKDKDITGDFEIDLNASGNPSIGAKPLSTANSVTIKFKPLAAKQDGMIFYVPLPTGTYTGYTLAINNQNGKQLTSFSSNSANTLNRTYLTKFPVISFENVDTSIEGDEQAAGTLVNGVAKLAKAGTLAEVLGEQMLTLSSLKIVGEINGSDVKCLRQMLGGSEFTTNKGILTTLDLSEVKIIEGGDSYYSPYPYRTANNEIGKRMFSSCSNLKTIIAPNSLKTIGESAFNGCSALTSVIILNNVTTIGKSAFENCKALTSVSIPNSVTTIGESAFWNCSALTSVSIPNSVTTIENSTFSGCDNLNSVTIGNSVNTIGNSAFNGCMALTSVSIPNSVITIGESAFNGCMALSNVTIPNSVTTIGASAFNGCNALTSITIPNSVTTMGEKCFQYCGFLTNVSIGDGVTTIENNTFSYCSNLNSVTIGNKVTTIGTSAFSKCSKLTSVSIPNSVTTIGESAFYDCKKLKDLTIGNNVTTIKYNAFSWCEALTSVSIPNSVITIEPGAFVSCVKLASVTFGNSVRTIGDRAFRACKLTSVTIPSSVTTIGGGAFDGSNMLLKVTCLATTPPDFINGRPFSTINTLEVPQGTKSDYEASAWKEYFTNIEELSE